MDLVFARWTMARDYGKGKQGTTRQNLLTKAGVGERCRYQKATIDVANPNFGNAKKYLTSLH